MTETKILIAINESPFAAKTLDVGIYFARLIGAQVGLVFVVDPYGAVAFPAKPLHFLREGRPAEEIIKTALEWNANLIVIRSHGRSDQ